MSAIKIKRVDWDDNRPHEPDNPNKSQRHRPKSRAKRPKRLSQNDLRDFIHVIVPIDASGVMGTLRGVGSAAELPAIRFDVMTVTIVAEWFAAY